MYLVGIISNAPLQLQICIFIVRSLQQHKLNVKNKHLHPNGQKSKYRNGHQIN